MKSIGALVLAIMLSTAAYAQSGKDQPMWEQRLDARHDQLIAENGSGTNAALRAQLLGMGKEDQRARGFVNGQPIDKDKYHFAPNLAKTDRTLTVELKKIVAAQGWPTIHLVGYEASNSAMLILNHSADHAWQHKLIPNLEQLASQNRIDGSALAGMIDKELVSEGKSQRYGTYFKFADGKLEQFAVDNPSQLDERRSLMYLSPMNVYRQQMSEMYHMSVSREIAQPDTHSK